MTSTVARPVHDRPTRLRQRLLAVGVAVFGAVLIWLVAVPAVGIDLKGPAGPGSTELEPIILPAVIAMSLGASLAGWALLATLERFVSRARTIWTATAAVVLVISLGGPLLGAGVPASSRLTLAALHIFVGGVLLTILPRTSSRA